MKRIRLKDYYYDDCLIVDEEWEEIYEGLYDNKVKDFDELLDIINKCNAFKYPLTRDNIIFKNLSESDAELDKIAQRQSRFEVIKLAVILRWMGKDILTSGLYSEGIEDTYSDFEVTFNVVLNNIHYGRIKEACIVREHAYDAVFYTYAVPQILIDELNNHKRTK